MYGIASRTRILLPLFALLLPASAAHAQASDYPRREITLMVGFAAGGSEDLRARSLAPRLSQVLGQPVIVVNRTGASGTIMLGQLAKAAPDGYTIGSISTSPMLFAPHMQPVSYHPGDFTYLAGSSMQPFCVCVGKDTPWKSMAQLLDFAKQNPGKLSYAHPGLGHQSRLFMESITRARNLQMTGIPFKGDAEAITAMQGGHVEIGSLSGSFVPLARSGALRPLLVFSETRLKMFPDVPTAKELGFTFDLRPATLLGYATPKGLPADIRRKLESAFEQAIKGQEFATVVEQMDGEVLYRNGDTFGRQVHELYESTGKMLKEFGI